MSVGSEAVFPWLLNLLVSLSRIPPRRPENLLVAALDQPTYNKLALLGVPVYWDPLFAGGRSTSTVGSGAARFGTATFAALTHLKNEFVYKILALGSAVVFTDADTVWLRNPLDEGLWGAEPPWPDDMANASAPSVVNDAGPAGTRINPFLSHACADLRLGDSVSGWGESAPWAKQRADCPGGVGGDYAYDVIGMYGDAGGMDTGYW